MHWAAAREAALVRQCSSMNETPSSCKTCETMGGGELQCHTVCDETAKELCRQVEGPIVSEAYHGRGIQRTPTQKRRLPSKRVLLAKRSLARLARVALSAWFAVSVCYFNLWIPSVPVPRPERSRNRSYFTPEKS